jgi:group I intron endonuclease
LIAKQNKGKSGVYRLVQKDSGKSYIGSSSMLNDRFRRYFNHSYLSSSKRGASLICKSLLKYGYAGFRLECRLFFLISKQERLKYLFL